MSETEKKATKKTATKKATTTKKTTTAKKATTTKKAPAKKPAAKAAPKKTAAKKDANPVVQLETNFGNITIELYPKEAPITVKNFIDYVEAKHYDELIFHRVIANFMVQGGGFDNGFEERDGKRAPIQNEANNGLKNDRGTIAMARTQDPHSATSQFFINHKDNDFLNFTEESIRGWGYAVFGKVTDGMDVVDKIASVKTTRMGYYDDVPEMVVMIMKATLV